MGSHPPPLPGTSCPAWGQVSEGKRPRGHSRASEELGGPLGVGRGCMMDLVRGFLLRAPSLTPQVLLPWGSGDPDHLWSCSSRIVVWSGWKGAA